MNKFIHTTIKLSFLSVIISMAALLNTAPTAGATTQTAHNGQSVVDNRLILNPEIGIHITVDDVSKDYYVPIGTVSDALNYLNITLSDDDIINADLSDTVYLGQKIKIDRVNYSYYPTHKEIPYTTVVQESSKLFVGQAKVYQQGKSGSTEYIYKDKYVNGELISHKCIKQQVLTYPTDKIIVKGNRNIDIINITGLNKRNSSKLFIKSILSYSPLRLRGFNLMDIVCEPNKGYGTALMKALLKYIENYNIEYIDGFLSPVDTADKSHKQRLLHFYSKFGFEIDEHNRIKKIFEKIPKTLDITPK